MRLFVILKIALRALKRNKMRSVLTALGIIIGVGAVIAMVAIGSGARASVEAQIAALGNNIILVFPGSSSSSGVRGGWGTGMTLTVQDADAIRSEVAGVAAVSPESTRGNRISAGNQNWFTRVQGESEEYFTIRDWAVAEGDLFTAADVQAASKIAVLGATVAENVFSEGDPIGKTIRVHDTPLTIRGVLARKGASFTGQDQDDVIFVPITSMRYLYGGHMFGGVRVNLVNVQVFSPDLIEVVKGDIAALLRQRHKLEPGAEDDFTVRTQEEIAAFATQQSRTMTLLLACIAGVSLVVGGIGIMNIMLVSVTERTREIGTRIAVGAHGKDIMTQFLVEAVLLSGLGGVLGIACGIGVSKLVAEFNNWPVLVPTSAVILAVGFSALVGVFFGFYPARKASRLDPIEALRFE
jgi:putative ABC transport system permease protein